MGKMSYHVARRVVAAGIVGLAAAAAFWPLNAAVVEHRFSRGVYPRIQTTLTWLSNQCPFAWLDVLAALVAVWVLWSLWFVFRRRGNWWRALLAWITSLLVAGAALYVVFAGVWGLNYRRVPLSVQLGFDRARVTEETTAAFASRAVDEVNNLRRERARTGPAGSGVSVVAERLTPAYRDVLADVGLPGARVARPKVPILTAYFNATGVSGMTNPFGLETLVASNLLEYERPLVVAHEWAHLAGIGPESEATLIGFLTCMRGVPDDRYSAWLDVTLRILPLLPPQQRRIMVDRLEPGVKADIRSMAERSQRDRVVWLSLAAWNVYDGYLKANKVPKGVRSYDEVVALLVGTRFTRDWRKSLRE